MLDEKQLKQRVLLRVLASPITLIPFVLGMTALVVTWAMGTATGLGLFAGLAGCLASVGAFVTNLQLNGARVARQVLEELEKEDRADKAKALDDLDHKLTEADEDPRPETMLRDLRVLIQAFDAARNSASRIQTETLVEVQARASQLFDQCVDSLEQTLKLGETASQVRSPAARKPIIQQREKIISDVAACIQQLSAALVAVQNLGASDSSTAQLKRIREELDDSLTIARTVEQRLESLVKDVDSRGTDSTLQKQP
jgi:hypothetical protein